jgi:beta-glucosidase
MSNSTTRISTGGTVNTDLAQLTLEEKALLTGGADLWHTAAIERAGVPALRRTDGPNGARGERWSSAPSACLPSTWSLT